MKLSIALSVEEILELIKKDILDVEETKNYGTDSVRIEVRVFS